MSTPSRTVRRQPVTVFRLDKKAPSTTRRQVALAQNFLSRLRTVRHPNVLKFLVRPRARVVGPPAALFAHAPLR